MFPAHVKNDTCIGVSPSPSIRPTQGTINSRPIQGTIKPTILSNTVRPTQGTIDSNTASTTVTCKCFNILIACKIPYFVVHIVVGLATGSTAVVLALLCFATFCFIGCKKHHLRIARRNYYTNPSVQLQTFGDHNSLSKLTTNTLPPPYDRYSEVSAPYFTTVCHTHEKGNRTLPPLPESPTIYQNQPCSFEKNQECASLSDTYVLPDNTEDIYEHMDSVMTTDDCQLKSDLYDNVI